MRKLSLIVFGTTERVFSKGKYDNKNRKSYSLLGNNEIRIKTKIRLSMNIRIRIRTRITITITVKNKNENKNKNKDKNKNKYKNNNKSKNLKDNTLRVIETYNKNL